MTQQSRRLKFLATLYPPTQTPVLATVLVSLLILWFSLWLPLAQLAQLTSAIILGLFILINGALIIIKSRDVYNGFQVYFWVPIVGVIASCILLFAQFL
jgi:hypothetical protein